MNLSPAITPAEYWRSEEGYGVNVVVREYNDWDLYYMNLAGLDEVMKMASGDYYYMCEPYPIVIDRHSVHVEEAFYDTTPIMIVREYVLDTMARLRELGCLGFGAPTEVGRAEEVNGGDGAM